MLAAFHLNQETFTSLLNRKPRHMLKRLNFFSDLSISCGERCLYDRIKKRRENSPVIAASESLFREEKGENHLAGNMKKAHVTEKKGMSLKTSPSPLQTLQL